MLKHFYAYVNGFLSTKQFENWIYSSVDLLSANLQEDKELFLQLMSCDYLSAVETEHLKNVLFIKYKNIFDTFNDNIINNKSLHSLVEHNNCSQPIVIFDCSGVDSAYKLQSKIKKVFKFPEWYGMNWDAFNDIIDLSNYEEVKFINFDAMKKKIPNEVGIFVKLLTEDKGNCKITFI